ncbi:MAG: elongation factor P [Candidatus Obscuribacter sp.]|mgnify:CR=1 FL=1|jgi:elongation factor P|nr:elongation factor P [Candidatus Obscuribacter sp.]MDQ5967252.1 Elongation factor [Cyanobacteriota bacterium erpe_2018_sw_39hr_WHONDRS-SW48-000098_B_bin.30]MBK7837479.1 elongation factor P [Candidatus Obscuribacter sp.]MBK9206294.1 elongation factor P [Candidatus Obscuribacter sp.]MBK9618200.1 elongation factor P [Candidatus Obscuribacter sp.]
MISSNDFRTGVTILYNNGIWQVVEFMHVKPGKGAAFVRTKLKNVESGNVLEQTFRAGEKLPTAIIEKSEFQFLYKSAENYTMMDQMNFEQMDMSAEQIGSGVEFLKEGLEGITVMRFNEKVIGVELPNTVELEVKETAPDERGDTSSGGGKPATLETGAVITVPFHIKVGDKLKVDTRNRKYLTRV